MLRQRDLCKLSRSIKILWTLASLYGLLGFGWGPPLAGRDALAAVQDAPPGWQPLGSPIGLVTHLAVQPGTANLYAVSAASTRRKDDQTQWQTAGKFVRSDALYRSRDNGATWQPASNNLIPSIITALYADSKTGKIYVGIEGAGASSTHQQGLWRSGASAGWEQVALGRDGLNIWRISRNAGGAYLFLGVTEDEWYPSDGKKYPASYVLRSSDNGLTWKSFRPLRQEPEPRGTLLDLLLHPTDPDRLFVSTDNGEIYASNDAGETWGLLLASDSVELSELRTKSLSNSDLSPSNPYGGTGAVQMAISPDQPSMMLVVRRQNGTGATTNHSSGKNLTVQRSMDGGMTWATLSASGLPVGAEPGTLAALGGGVFLLSTNFGTYRSGDRGTTWQRLEGPLSSGDVAEFVSLPQSPATVLAATGYGVYISRDAGALWQRYGEGLPFNSKIVGLLTDARQPERIFAISDDLEGARAEATTRGTTAPPMLLRSMDNGRSWTPASQGLPNVSPTAWTLDPNDPNTFFISSRDYFFRTTDGGLNWQTTQLNPSGHLTVAVAPSDPNILYLGGSPPLRSTDKGTTWQEIPIAGLEQPKPETSDEQQSQEQGSRAGEVTGLIVDPANPAHVWASLYGKGIYESTDAGASWQTVGLPDKPVRWLASDFSSASGDAGDVKRAASTTQSPTGKVTLYAGVSGDGIYRQDGQTGNWTVASNGLPDQSTILSLIPDPRAPGTLWAGRDGGGVYRSTDFGMTWTNVPASDTSGAVSPARAQTSLGDNLVRALAIDYSAPGGVLIGTATTGVWALRPNAQPAAPPRAVDARIEVVWPHDWAPVAQAKLANIGLRLFRPDSLLVPPCTWTPEVTVWQALDTNPAEPLDKADQRSVDGAPFPYWELNDVDISRANNPAHTLYFMVLVTPTNPLEPDSMETHTSIWAHGSDPRTYLPYQDVPSGVALGDIDAVDARIQIVWPHDEIGAGRPVTESTYANVSVAFFKHDTRLSVPVGWQPSGLTLYGAWNQEIGRALAKDAVVQVRQAGAITYPTWEFNNIPVTLATNPANKLYLWVIADGIDTYPTIWTHGADPRTFFPAQDEPIQGCVP